MRHGRTLLADGDINAVKFRAFVITLIDGFLVQNRVNGDGGFTGLAVTNDELALTATDRDERIHRLQTRLHRFVHGFARNNARCLNVHFFVRFGFDRPLAVQRIAERVNNATQKPLADRHAHNITGPFNRIAFANITVGTENHDTDIVFFQIERHAANAAGKLHHFTRLHIVEAVNPGNAVTDRQNLADFRHFGSLVETFDLLFQN